MNQQGGARQVEKMMQQYGCLPSLNESATIEAFSPKELALAIEQEANKASDYGFTKITMHFDIPDALLLAKELRK